MMHCHLQRNQLLSAIQGVSGIVERRQSDPLLSHVLLSVSESGLTLRGTDLEIEIATLRPLEKLVFPGNVTLPARKLMDICRALPDGASIQLRQQDHKVQLSSGKSRFTLGSLEPSTFPSFSFADGQQTFTTKVSLLKDMFSRTSYAIAQQDVRFYLNGLFVVIKDNQLSTVASDGHRLVRFQAEEPLDSPETSLLLPRKAVIELMRLLQDEDSHVTVEISPNQVKVTHPSFLFYSKQIEAKYPDYRRVIPQQATNQLRMDRDMFKQALIRMSILTDDKYKGVRLQLHPDKVLLTVHTPEQEVAEEELPANYHGEAMSVGFNVAYFIEALNHFDSGDISVNIKDGNSGILLQSEDSEQQYHAVIMPMQI